MRRQVDPVDRAHLTGVSRPAPPISRYPPSAPLADLIERYWVPVWSVPAPQQQTTLQHPVCLIVVSNTYARLYGVARGRSTVTLDGDGWAVGTMFTPAAGRLVLGDSMATLTDRYVDLTEVVTLHGPSLVRLVREAMADEPTAVASHTAAIETVEEELSRFVPVDESGLLINRVVAWLSDHPEITRVADVAEEFALTERTLQRLVEQRVGLSPKWLIQRRRLHDAVTGLKAGDIPLATLAAELGYTDQAHFTHDFRTVTGMTPGEYLTDQPR